jgi:hypothetical protein
MQENKDIWYHLGYALETARQRLPSSGGDSSKTPRRDEVTRDVSKKVLDALLTVGAGSLVTKSLSFLPGRRKPGLFRLFRAGAAGAAAAFLAELLRPALRGSVRDATLEEELTDILLSGAGRGLLYAGVVAPHLPAPPALQGTAYAALEYALIPWGGLEELAGSISPHGRIPVLSVLLKSRGEDEQFLEHLVFGLALALLYDR